MDEAARRRLYWKSRRGLLELDLVFQKFIEKNFENKDEKAFNDLLDLEDQELWDIVSGRSDRYEKRLGGIVARLRAV